LETVLLHKSAFLYVTSIFRLSSFVFANALLTGITKTFVPFYSSFPEIYSDPSDHLYYDNASPKDDDPTQVGNIEKNKYSYNSGQPLQLACLLYKITQENSYLNLAKQIAEACHNKWFKQFHSDILKRDFKVLSPGHAWFNTIMCRGFFELYSIDKNSLYLEDIHSTMLHAWFGKAHHNNGLINNEDLSGLSGDIPTEDGGNKWQILHQGALVELYARLAVWEKKQN